MKKISIKVSLILFCIIFFSCAKKQTVRQAELEPYTGPVTVEILKESVGFRNVKSIKSFVDARVYKHRESEGSFSGVFGYKSSGYVRTSFFGPFGLTVMDILLTNDLFQMHIPPKNLLYEWNSPEISFNSLKNNRFRYTMEDTDDMYILYAFNTENGNSDIAVKYFFDRTYLLNRSIIFYREGLDFIKIEFNDYNGTVPEQTRIIFHKGMSMDIRLREPELNSDIPDKYFKAIEHGDKKVKDFQETLKRFDPNR